MENRKGNSQTPSTEVQQVLLPGSSTGCSQGPLCCSGCRDVPDNPWRYFRFTLCGVQLRLHHHLLAFNFACHILLNAQAPLFPLTFISCTCFILWKHLWGSFSARTGVADCTSWFCYLSCFASSFLLISGLERKGGELTFIQRIQRKD